jgi:hypothetical protein
VCLLGQEWPQKNSLGDLSLANPRPNGSDADDSRKSELNPLLNPVLEQNLSRWAHVYFTNPPETRDQAVMDLLRELEANASPEPAGEPTPEPVPSSAPAKIICPVCELQNRPEQRFCGFCGTPLYPRQPKVTSVKQTVVETPSVLGLSSPPPETPPPDANDLQFLRERPFRSEYYEPESASHRGAYVIVALIVLLAAVAYLKWPFLRQHLQAVLQRPAVVQPTPAASPKPQPASVPPQPTGVSTQPATIPVEAVQQQPPPPVEPPHATKPPQTISPKNASLAANHPPSAVKLASDTEISPANNGAQELLLAQRYLQGTQVPRDASVAARYLWKAVAKQNTQADVLLADLYARGDGVSKSCNQARVLLVAASEKGDSTAAQKLRELESGTCR